MGVALQALPTTIRRGPAGRPADPNFREAKMAKWIWWGRTILLAVFVIFGVLAIWGMLHDGDRGLRVLPWATIGLLGIGYLIAPKC